MKVKYSKAFEKSARLLSGKSLKSLSSMLAEVKHAESLSDITDSIKLTNFKNTYRIRIGSYRAFFTCHIEVVDDVVYFEYLVSRGQAYSKEMEKKLKAKD
ncbi:hypothetical protein HMPREF3034_00310 [Prevotella sp. DNF00663]|uniref:hypothetical protein n=1 Tax=unclassified Prevotella TaxID=2638335 RepID=UPI000512B93F|nr:MULTISPECIES: hypothetical protein [unclassified Prevotella]KGI61514.1 hypothetical protein HMPREF0671_00595 [Prevotella sp. S7 MS 2]KXB85129.1 hypothetical protein HMPREF3034_00310 [Prevotella sp. DNF00663]